MKNKIDKILGSKFKKEHNVKLLSIKIEDNIVSMLISYGNEESMFRIDTNNDLKSSIEVIKSIIKNEVEFKEK